MSIASGTKLGPYEILSAIGAGGMGEVYRARDPKLGRDVAIKVLPEAFANDAQRMARFQREAKVLASLDHPNIASIYGLEDSGGTRALVMQLVEGPTLADRIKAGPIPVDESVRIAKQIADALEYAHERGIIHRDLKPANVKATNDDVVKVLDFGLAKALEGDPSSIDISTSPTISRMATMQGVLLGTAAYMSPEQAKAKSVDRRADIWAFGCVLYEMLTGKQAFTGETVTDTLASIIKEEPDWKLLPATTPMRVRVLLQRCLQKDPKQRLRDIGDARISLDEVISGGPEGAPSLAVIPAPVPFWRRALPWAMAGFLAIALAIVAWAPWRVAMPPALAEPVRFQIPVPDNLLSPTIASFAVSPNGRQLAFDAGGSDGVARLWIHSLDSLEARPLSGTELHRDSGLFWSPDSRFIAFGSGEKLKKIPVSGGPAETICDFAERVIGGSWNRDGVIVFGTERGPLMRVSAAGGSPSALTTVDASRQEINHAAPWFLPDGRHFLYVRVSTVAAKTGVYVGSLDVKPEEQSLKLLVAALSTAGYMPSADPNLGYVLFARDAALLAQPFNTSRRELAGEAVTVADGLASNGSAYPFSISTNGVLAYRGGGKAESDQLTWYDRQGKVAGTTGEAASQVVSVRLSPDGSQAAVSSVDVSGQGRVVLATPFSSQVIRLLDFERGTSTRFTFGPGSALFPVWSPDGNRIVFSLARESEFDLYQKPANGATNEELLLKSPQPKFGDSWSSDGKFFLYSTYSGQGKSELWVLPLEGDKKPFPYLQTEFNNERGRFSPDGRWIAYASDESGRFEIYVRQFSPDSRGTSSSGGGKWLISTGGGINPRWRRDGNELYYFAPDGKIMAVEVATSPAFRAGVPKALFEAPLDPNSIAAQWDVTADGKRFLIPASKTQSEQPPFNVVLNWQAALKK
jgi:eukaryotic-like serine/threonine-protein kinase